MTSPYSAARANENNDDRHSFSGFEPAVNSVIETLIDGVNGFTDVAEQCDGSLASTLSSMAATRKQTAEDLIRIAADADMDPTTLADDGTASGAVHRAWIGIRETIQGDSGLLADAINGEQHARDEITDSLDEGLPAAAATIARRALTEIEDNLTTLGRLKAEA